LAHFRAEGAATVHAVGGSVAPLTIDTAARRYVAAHNPLQPLEQTAPQDGSPLRRAWAYLAAEIGLVRRPDGPRPVRSLVGASMAFRRSTLDALGGFDERIRFGGEEEDLCRRLGEVHGPGAVWFDPEVEIRHDFDRTTRDVLRRRVAYGRGNARTFLKARRTVPPVPPAAATAVLLAPAALRGRRQATRWLALPALFYLLATVRGVRRPAQLIGHPLLRFLEEACTFTGFVTGWIAFRSHYRGGRDG
jgi:GT2 family glycosyltransferase